MGTKPNEQISAIEARRLGRDLGALNLATEERGIQVVPAFNGSLLISLFVDKLIVAQVTVDKDSRLEVFHGFLLHKATSIRLFDKEQEIVAAYIAGFYGDAS